MVEPGVFEPSRPGDIHDSQADISAAQKAFGYAPDYMVRTGLKETNIKMPNGQLITIPVSGDLKIGLLKAAIKIAGLTEEEFERLM